MDDSHNTLWIKLCLFSKEAVRIEQHFERKTMFDFDAEGVPSLKRNLESAAALTEGTGQTEQQIGQIDLSAKSRRVTALPPSRCGESGEKPCRKRPLSDVLEDDDSGSLPPKRVAELKSHHELYSVPPFAITDSRLPLGDLMRAAKGDAALAVLCQYPRLKSPEVCAALLERSRSSATATADECTREKT